ncbi:MAG TPA: condensation domain-containing protein, partial [Longimicrobium sp.]
VLLFAPVHFDASVTDLFTPLCAGGTLVMAPRDALIPGPELVEMLRARRVTHAKFTPSALAALPFAPLPELEVVMTGGEACAAELVARWAPGRRFVNGYGPTEGSVRVTAVDCADGTRTPPLGRPLANTRVYVLDAHGRPVPVGVAGELCIGGVQVARGYLGRPALTAEKFIPDAFGLEPGGRLYRSGDRVRYRHDGSLEFLGRTDFQVKIRGYRIETGEVEAVLRDHPAVRDAAVVAREDVPGDRRLVAYAVPRGDAAPTAQALRDAARERLPEYMVPAAFVLLERLPVTSTGKVDRAALPAPEREGPGERYAAPRTPAEETLAGIWAEVLHVERVGVHDNFFELGGHSLLGTRVVSRVREVFGVEPGLRALFEAPTVAGLAARVDALRRAGEPAPPPLVPVERTGALPLSLIQERFWFLSSMPGSGSYVIPAVVRLGGALDVPALERALGEVVRRHEALRTSFGEADGAPVQVIAPFTGFALAVEDVSHLGPDAREAELLGRALDDAGQPFDLAAGPLFRASLLRLADDEHALLLAMHHVVSDGWSLGVFHRELAALYAAYRDGRESPLDALPVQYADYAAWQAAQLRGDVLEAQLAYWRARLAGAPALLELPTDFPRPAVQAYRGGYEHLALGPELLQGLRALGRAEGATLYMVGLAAFQVLLARYGAGEDVVVGSPIAGRTRPEVEPLIGFFVNTLALRTDLSGDPPFREVLRRVRETTLGAYDHQDLPFEKLVAELQPERSLSYSPLFQVTFAADDALSSTLEMDGLRVEPVEADAGTIKVDLALTLSPSADGLAAGLAYRTDLFEHATAARMLAHLRRVLEQAVADPAVRLSRVELLDAAERHRVVVAWNHGADVPAGCIHTLFAAQARRTPDADAL